MQAMYAEDPVFDVSAVFVDTAPVRGRENMRRYWDELWEIWGGLGLDVLLRQRTKPPGSGGLSGG